MGLAGPGVGAAVLIALSAVIAPTAPTGLNASTALRGSSGLAVVSALVTAVPALIALIAASVLAPSGVVAASVPVPSGVVAVRGQRDLIVVSASRVQAQGAVMAIAAMDARSVASLGRDLAPIAMIERNGLSAMSGARVSHLLLRVQPARKLMI